VRKSERRRQILSQARQLFLAHGYSGTTREAIAAASGISEAVLRRYFSDLPALFAAIVADVRSATLDYWQAEAAAQTDPLAKLHLLIEQFLVAAREGADLPFFHRTLLENPDEAVLAQLREFYVAAETLLAGVIAEGQQTGVFRRSLDPRVGAWELIRSTLGYALTLPLRIPLHGEPEYLAQATDCMLHCLLKTDV
jgi:AcrR family transcriptional regulator